MTRRFPLSVLFALSTTCFMPAAVAQPVDEESAERLEQARTPPVRRDVRRLDRVETPPCVQDCQVQRTSCRRECVEAMADFADEPDGRARLDACALACDEVTRTCHNACSADVQAPDDVDP